MTEPLVSVSDPDWAAYRTDDPEWFLRVAGRTVRQYCGWHIYPNVRVTKHKLKVGGHGIIMLPSGHVTAVDSVTIHRGAHEHHLHHDEYAWFEAGWIERKGLTAYNDGWFAGPAIFGNDPFYLPVTEPGLASVTFSHGYPELPEDVKAVCFELAEAAMTLRSGNVEMLEAPIGYRVQLSQNAGANLNDEQRARLSAFRIGTVA